MNTPSNLYFVSGIDTNVGKSYATGYLARQWNEQGIRTITQKFVQTGNTDLSEDIELHRRIMGCGLLPEDHERLTMPEIFSYPCSPHLAAEIDHRPIDFAKIEHAASELALRFDAVLQEGAGGLMVPLTRHLLTIDYVAQRHLPLIFVTSGRLGSISHTLLSLEAIERRGIRLHTLAYNLFPTEDDTTIQRDTEDFIRQYVQQHFPDARFEVVPQMEV
ncbi:MAG: dethiobiotin synthase [Bacteroidaceae bacterium]